MPVYHPSNPSGGRSLRPGLRLAPLQLLLLLLALFGAARGMILRPFEDATGADVALVVLAGANVPAARYAPLGRAIQKALVADGLRLWVGIPDEDMVRDQSIAGFDVIDQTMCQLVDGIDQIWGRVDRFIGQIKSIN